MPIPIRGNYRAGSRPGIGLRIEWKPYQVGNWLFRLGQSVELTSSAYRAGSILAAVIGADGRLDPTKGWLASKTGLCERTIARALAKLARLGFLTWHRRTAITEGIEHQTSNAYQLQFPENSPPPREPTPEPLSTSPSESLSDNNIDSISTGKELSDTAPAIEQRRVLPVRLIRQAQKALTSQRKAMEARMAAVWRGRRGAS